MATIIEIITAIVMLTPEDANLLKTTHPAPIQKTSIKTIPHPGIFSFILIYNSTFKYHSAKYKHKKRRPNRHPSPGIAKHPRLSLKTWGIALKFLFLHHENILFPND